MNAKSLLATLLRLAGNAALIWGASLLHPVLDSIRAAFRVEVAQFEVPPGVDRQMAAREVIEEIKRQCRARLQ
jgi:hypothetical protein